MKKLLVLILCGLSLCNYASAKKIIIDDKIILEVSEKFTFIEGDSDSELIQSAIGFMGNNIKTYLIGTKKSINFTKEYQENPDELFEEISNKMERKNFKSQPSAESFLAREIKKLFKKRGYEGVIWLILSDTEISQMDDEITNLVNEIREMDSQILKKELKNYQREWSNTVRDAFGELGPYIKISKLIIKKNQLNDPYAKFSINYKVKTLKGKVDFYMSIKDNKPIALIYECMNLCPKKYDSLEKIILPTFSENKITKIKSNNKDNNKSSNVVEQLQELNDLYKGGVLTKEEFEKAKKKILN
mgnify:CR=1 FL=1